MKTPFPIAVLSGATAIALWASVALAEEAVNKTSPGPPDSKKSEAAPPAFTYKPPLRGAPVTRVGGGTRSVDAKAVTLSVLAPNETGYTLRDTPTIYWYLSETVTSPVELTITSNASLQDASPPVLEITLQPPVNNGIHALRLEEHGVVLKPGVEYQWFVAVVRNPAQRSSDVVAGGSIKRMPQSDAVQTKLKQATQASWPAVYAEEGIWYDAIDRLSKLIGADPANRQLRQQRAALLEQVGLRDAAAFDRGAVR